MGSTKKNFFLLVLIIIMSISSLTAYADTTYMEFPEETVIPSKTWTITLSNPIKIDSSTYNYIKIYDTNTNQFVKINIVKGKDDKSVLITPLNDYVPLHKYALTIEQNLKDIYGNTIKQPSKKYFTVNDPTMDTFKPTGIVNSYKDFYNEIKYALTNFQPSLSLKIYNYKDDLYPLETVNKVIQDNPLIDYGYTDVSGDISTNSYYSYVTYRVNFNYAFTKSQMVLMKSQAESKAQKIINSVIKENMKDYEKEIALHDYLVNNTKYDYINYLNDSVPPESHLDYGALVKNIAVCDGYSKAMYRLLNAVGIKCLVVEGTDLNTGGSHEWNIVSIGGKYYHLDATFNDPTSTNMKNTITHQYFNLSDAQISKDHIWDRTKFPLCTSSEYNYFNLNVDEFDGEGNKIVPVKTYGEFYDAIETNIYNGVKKIYLRTPNEDVYDVYDVISSLNKSDCSIYFYIKNGYSTELSVDNINDYKYITIIINT